MTRAINIYCDGGGNKGTIGCWGWVAYDEDGTIIEKQGGLLPRKASNNVAEYTAVAKALWWAWENSHLYHIDKLMTDSFLVVNQANNEWKCNAPKLRKYLDDVQHMMGLVQLDRLTWVSREENVEADRVGRKLREEAIKNER